MSVFGTQCIFTLDGLTVTFRVSEPSYIAMVTALTVTLTEACVCHHALATFLALKLIGLFSNFLGFQMSRERKLHQITTNVDA